MSKSKLYIGDESVDILSSKLVLRIQKFSASDLSARIVSSSNSFDSAWTENNLRLFGFAGEQNSNSQMPYRLRDCKYLENGIEPMPGAKLYIKTPDKEGFKIAIIENAFEFFSTLEGLTLRDIDPIAASAWTATAIDSARTNTTGIISAVMSWGRSSIYEVNYFLPCFYYHTIITSILEYTGLTLSGNILTDSRFKDLVMTFSGEFLYPQEFVNQLSGKSYKSVTQVITGLVTGVDVSVGIDENVYGADNFSNPVYLTPFESNISIAAPVSITVNAFNDGTVITVKLVKNVSTVLDSDTVTTIGANSVTLTYTGDFDPSDSIGIVVSTNAPLTGVDFDINPGISLTYLEIIGNRTINRNKVFWNELWPSIPVKEFIKDFFTRFFIIPKQVGTTLYLKTMEEIIADRFGAIDWSSKLVASKEPIDLTPDYAQNNYFKYSDKAGDVGNGNMPIANELIQQSRTIYTSVFSNCNTSFVAFSYNVALLPVYNADSTRIDDMDEKPSVTLLTLKSHVNEVAVTFNATPRTDYKLAYFVDLGQSKDTGWQYFIDQFYPSFSNALQKSKLIKKVFNLDVNDIKAYDPHKMIWDGTGFFVLEKINDFQSEQLTNVDLFKV